MSWYLQVLKKYAVFTGRARRMEYWMFFLFNLLIALALGVLEGVLGIAPEGDQSVLVSIYWLAILIPGIAVGVRRMHDTDHSGWWLLFPIVNLVLAVREGQHGDNRFGPDPKATSAVPTVASSWMLPGGASEQIFRDPAGRLYVARGGVSVWLPEPVYQSTDGRFYAIRHGVAVVLTTDEASRVVRAG